MTRKIYDITGCFLHVNNILRNPFIALVTSCYDHITQVNHFRTYGYWSFPLHAGNVSRSCSYQKY